MTDKQRDAKDDETKTKKEPPLKDAVQDAELSEEEMAKVQGGAFRSPAKAQTKCYCGMHGDRYQVYLEGS